MSFLKRMKLRSCPKCKNAKIPYGQKHTCNPSRDEDVAPENRPELHYRKDVILNQGRRFGTDEIKRQERSANEVPRSTGGTAAVSPYIPKAQPEPKRSYQQKIERQNEPKVTQREEVYPETEMRYENPSDVRSMDYTKDYAHAYREEGKYGSHSSHDGFDDESNP